jgi:hypothetical protein
VYSSEITPCHYKGLLQEYVMLCYGFLNKWPLFQCYGFPHKRPLLHHVVHVYRKVWCKVGHKVWWHSHSTEQDTQSIVFVISNQVVSFQTRGGTYCPRVSTPKIRSLAYSSTTCHDGINHLHHSIHCSNHSINSHTVKSHLDGWKITLSQIHKPNSTSQRMEDLYDT